MKQISLIIIIIMNITLCRAQQTIKPIEQALSDSYENNPNTYYKDTNNLLQQCVGTWEYSSGPDYFKITFTKTKILANEKYNVFRDCLVTKYIYKKNGTTIYDNYGLIAYPAGSSVNKKNADLRSSYVKDSEISFVYDEPSFTDCHRRKVGSLNITYIPDTPARLTWARVTDTRYFVNGPCDNGAPADNSEFLIPENMILVKIN